MIATWDKIDTFFGSLLRKEAIRLKKAHLIAMLGFNVKFRGMWGVLGY